LFFHLFLVRDLMRAASDAAPALMGTGNYLFNGATDANYRATPNNHASHDLGMAFDLGISNLVAQNDNGQFKVNEALISALTAALAPGQEGVWDNQRAAALAANLASQTGNNQARAMLNFLALYSVTRDAGGSWGSLVMSNDAAGQSEVRTALFGDGTVGGSMISKVLIGGKTDKPVTTGSSWYIAQNPYRNMRLVLDRLGVQHNVDTQPNQATSTAPVVYSYANNSQGVSTRVYHLQMPNGTTVPAANHGGVQAHQSHFHIFIQPPTLKLITPNPHNLVTDNSLASANADDDQIAVLQQSVQNMLSDTATSTNSGDQDMFVVDLPDISPPPQSIVIAQNASSAPVAPQLKIPRVVMEVPWQIGNDASLKPGNPTSFDVDLGGWACTELRQDYKLQKLHWTSTTCKIVEIVTPPKHGSFASEGNGIYRYTPQHGLIGKDRVQFIVEGEDGRRAFVTLPILLQSIADAYSSNEFGNDPIAVWSQSNESDIYTASWDAWLRAAIGDVSLSFADLTGGAVGQTTGEGPNAAITLDDNAAGNGWFIKRTGSSLDITVLKRTGSSLDITVLAATISRWHALYA
jgi:hypothetical protein